MKLSPANYVILVLGGVRATARVVDRHPASVIRWKKPKNQGGFGGRIPTVPRETILKHAKRNNLPITSTDLDNGRDVRIAR